MTKEKRLALYEKALIELADWDYTGSWATTDDNGASALWARDLLTKAGKAPKREKR